MKKNYFILFITLVVFVGAFDQISKIWAVYSLGNHHSNTFLDFTREYLIELGPVGLNGFPYLNSIHNFKPALQIVPGWFEFYLTLNDGAAWSLLSGKPILLAMISLIMIMIFSTLWRIKYQHNFVMSIGFGMMIGGALGNFIDRWRLNVVIDFLKFSLPERVFHFPLLNDFPIFNLADSFAVSGILLIGLHLLLVELDKENKLKKSGTTKQRTTYFNQEQENEDVIEKSKTLSVEVINQEKVICESTDIHDSQKDEQSELVQIVEKE